MLVLLWQYTLMISGTGWLRGGIWATFLDTLIVKSLHSGSRLLGGDDFFCIIMAFFFSLVSCQSPRYYCIARGLEAYLIYQRSSDFKEAILC